MIFGLLAPRYILPTMGFHRVVEAWPGIVQYCPDARLEIFGLFNSKKFPEYTDDFISLIKKSPSRGAIKLVEKRPTREQYSTFLHSMDVLLLPFEAGESTKLLTDAMRQDKAIVSSDLAVFKRLLRGYKKGCWTENMPDYIRAVESFISKLARDKA